MNTKHIHITVIAFLGAVATVVATPEEKFEKDREAILAMQGAHEVVFSFKEVYPLYEGYRLRDACNESARELVKLIADDGERIVLQHLLVVGKESDPTVVKHWGQIWTYEDTVVLEYQKGDTWSAKRLAPEKVKGSWSQLVTQTDDSPRYESYGTWVHSGGTSEWVSAPTRRPLPRREYTKRSDYQVLIAENRHVVTASGWSHFQLNRKRVERESGLQDLCIENGLNTYTKIESNELAAAEKWWGENEIFWKPMGQAWREATDLARAVDLSPVKDKSFARVLKELRKDAAEGVAPSSEQLSEVLSPFLKN